MSNPMLLATAVTVAYKEKAVLQGLNLTVKKGEICALLGPNGAGKTTLLKALTGLIPLEQGEVALFGEAFSPAALRRTGCMLERPALYSAKTVAENLRLYATLLGLPENPAPILLDQVGLGGSAGTRVSKLSMGMRQRLGLAVALMGNPDLLILDEPVNALDTQGMYDMRCLLQSLNRERGVTILLTSHLLDEVARLATCYAFLHGGSVRQLSGAQVEASSRQYAHIATGDPSAAAVVLDRFVQEEPGYEVQPDGSFHLYQALDRLPEINAALVEAGVPVLSLSIRSANLADFYLQETKGGAPLA